MARMPGAQWRPLGDDQTHQPLMSAHKGIVLHTMVGSLAGTDAYFRQGGYSGTESHFGVGYDGTIYQWVDTERTADANLEGNMGRLSIETADSGTGFPSWTGSNVPPWLPAQLEAIARIIAWAAAEHNFPISRMPDSLPSRRGVGYHRLGIDPYRVSGGEKWSNSYAKACPGDRRIAQVDQVIQMAQSGGKAPWPAFRETSSAVGEMVDKLAANGYFKTKHRDRANYYGAWTRGAITRLQESFDDTKMDPDGLIGQRTWAHIQSLKDEQKPPPPPPPPPPDHSWPILDEPREAIGDAIRAMQVVVETRPKWRFGSSMLERWQADWRQLHDIQNPDK